MKGKMDPDNQLGAKAEAPIDSTPLANDLWLGIAGHFDSITQVIAEFIDNSLSNLGAFKQQPCSIRVALEEEEGERVRVKIEDTGTGIPDLAPVMRLGDKTVRQTPLNEHGFGLKHALASANPSNDAWTLYTRTADDFAKGTYKRLKAPYSFLMTSEKIEIVKVPWPGVYNGGGTLIEFVSSPEFFNTVQRGIKGQAKFGRCLEYLTEELGYIYSGVIEKGQATITITSAKASFNQNVQAVKPSWVDYYPPGCGSAKVDLGGGTISVEYQFGQVRESEYKKHYRKSMSTSGVEIRINGRVVMSNVFKEIWGLENHPSYNHFLAVINLVSASRDALPQTRTSKNGIRSGDPKLENLLAWIHKTHPKPHTELASAQSERELVRELADLKQKHIPHKAKRVEAEFKVFTTIGSLVSVDLYVFDGTDIVLYEAKKDEADVQDIYQLLMYWDGLVEDGFTPTQGILIATSFSPGVNIMLEVLNDSKDRKGNKYSFITKTWSDEGIKYPK